MCEATTMMAIGAFFTVGTGLMQAQGIKFAAEAEAQSYLRQAEAAGYNAGFAAERAKDAILRGGQEEISLRRKGRQILGSQKATMAAAGLDTSSGSALDVAASTTAAIEEDAAAIRLNAQREQWGHLVDRFNLLNQKSSYIAAAKAARTMGTWNMYTSLLNTAAKTAMIFV